MKSRLTIIILAFLALAATATAQNIKAVTGKVNNGYNFWLAEPSAPSPSDSITEKPLVVFLHGASLQGNNLNRVLRYGTIDAIKRGLGLDAYVIAPQTVGAWQPGKVMNTIDYVLDNVTNIDKNRIYVIGMSLGGYGTIDLAATYPDKIAAAMAICGGGTAKSIADLNNLPLWIVHGTADRAVSIKESDKVVNAMKAADKETPRLIYDRVAGMNHSQPARLLYMPEVYSWLFSHSLEDKDRSVAPGFKVDNNAMRGAYTNLKGSNVLATNRFKEIPHVVKPQMPKTFTVPEKEEPVEVPVLDVFPEFEPIPLIIVPGSDSAIDGADDTSYLPTENTSSLPTNNKEFGTLPHIVKMPYVAALRPRKISLKAGILPA